MKALRLFALFGVWLWVGTSNVWAAACHEECTSTVDCVSASCPVCIGVCTSCLDLGTQELCEDTASAADLYCEWRTNDFRCAFIGDVPELGPAKRSGVFLLLALGLVLFSILGLSWKRVRPR